MRSIVSVSRTFLGFEICVIVSIASGAARGSSEIVLVFLVGSINHYPLAMQLYSRIQSIYINKKGILINKNKKPVHVREPSN